MFLRFSARCSRRRIYLWNRIVQKGSGWMNVCWGGETVSDSPAAHVTRRRTDYSGFRRVYSVMEMDVIACTRLRWRGDRGIA